MDRIPFFLLLLIPSCTPSLAGGEFVAGQNPLTPGESDALANFLSSLATDHSWTVTAMLLIGACRVLMKPFFSLLHYYVAQTPSTHDDELLQRVENSRALQTALWIADLVLSIKVLPVTPAQKTIAAVITARGTTDSEKTK